MTTSSASRPCSSNLLLVQEFIQHRVHFTERKLTIDYFSVFGVLCLDDSKNKSNNQFDLLRDLIYRLFYLICSFTHFLCLRRTCNKGSSSNSFSSESEKYKTVLLKVMSGQSQSQSWNIISMCLKRTNTISYCLIM